MKNKIEKLLKLKKVSEKVSSRALHLVNALVEAEIEFFHSIDYDYVEFTFGKNDDTITFAVGDYKDGIEYHQTAPGFSYFVHMGEDAASKLIKSNDFSWAGKRFF